jgi:hypothetical protein
MTWLRTIWHEFIGLFVDDGSFAAAILIWLGVAWLVLPRLDTSGTWSGIALFLGLVLILFESVLRRVRTG